jgi:branched-chain amino acid transport system substrate-binding protein
MKKLMKSTISLLLLCTLVLVTFLSHSCLKKQPESKEIKIGAIVPLTGNFATYGEPVRDGMLLAAEEINSKGSIKGNIIKLIIEDDAGDPKTAVNAFTKLAEADKVPLVLGPLSSGASLATAPVAEGAKVVQISTLAGIPELSKAGDYIFRIYPSSEVGARFAANEAIKKFSPKKVAVMYMNNPFGQTAQKIYIDTAIKVGIEVVAVESFSDGESDFRTQLSKVKERAPDVLFCSAYWGEGSKILVQMQEFGLNIPVVGEDGWRGPIADIVGVKGLKNLYFADLSFGPEFTENEIMQDFIKAFKNKYQENASAYSATGYDAVYIAKKAIDCFPSARMAQVKVFS